ncbi:MAG: hypothetical protein JO131_08925, partial [Gammaproteobacteria bacterium]|nr:hypothetical protein [Gammaproteobacteria bacterium]
PYPPKNMTEYIVPNSYNSLIGDFAPDEGCIIEFDGALHTNRISKDGFKDRLYKILGMHVIRIPLTPLKKLERQQLKDYLKEAVIIPYLQYHQEKMCKNKLPAPELETRNLEVKDLETKYSTQDFYQSPTIPWTEEKSTSLTYCQIAKQNIPNISQLNNSSVLPLLKVAKEKNILEPSRIGKKSSITKNKLNAQMEVTSISTQFSVAEKKSFISKNRLNAHSEVTSIATQLPVTEKKSFVSRNRLNAHSEVTIISTQLPVTEKKSFVSRNRLNAHSEVTSISTQLPVTEKKSFASKNRFNIQDEVTDIDVSSFSTKKSLKNTSKKQSLHPPKASFIRKLKKEEFLSSTQINDIINQYIDNFAKDKSVQNVEYVKKQLILHAKNYSISKKVLDKALGNNLFILPQNKCYLFFKKTFFILDFNENDFKEDLRIHYRKSLTP